MFFRFIILAVSFALASLALAQAPCDFGSPEAADNLEKSLQQASTCKAAADLYSECRWGSSADVGFAGIVIKKCEQAYIGKLSIAQKNVYEDKMQLCTYEYDRQDGTLAISEAVSCHVGVAIEFAGDLKKAAIPLPAASFDCRVARSPLEKAICLDSSLGRADLVLSRVYSAELKSVTGEDKATLIQTETKWLRELPGKCGLTAKPPSPKVFACLRNDFEQRFTLLDECGVGDMASCLTSDSRH